MANKFEKGDIVVLKSGGPPMTVEQVPGERSFNNDEYRCCWFKGATAAQGDYPEHVLDKYVQPIK